MRPPIAPTLDYGDAAVVTRLIAESRNRPLSLRLQVVLLRMLGKTVNETATLCWACIEIRCTLGSVAGTRVERKP